MSLLPKRTAICCISRHLYVIRYMGASASCEPFGRGAAMRVRKKRIVASSLVAITLVMGFAAKGESPAVCQMYAQEAVSAFRTAQSRNCAIQPPRWQASFNNHLNWCLSASPEAVKNEGLIRLYEVNLCTNPTDLLRRCDTYAKTAVSQEQENLRRDCRIAGPEGRWSTSYEAHFVWCNFHNDQNAERIEQREREGPLTQCRTTNPLH